MSNQNASATDLQEKARAVPPMAKDKAAVAPAVQRWVYMDVCKIVAFVLIVFTNIVSGVWGIAETGSSEWVVLNVYNGLSRFSVPLFFLMLGALLLNPLKELSIKEIYLKFLLPVLTAFLFWSTAYVLFTYAIYSPGNFAHFNLREFISTVLQGDPYRHWFVFLIAQLYLVLPFLRAIAKNLSACRCFLVLWMIFTLFVTTLNRIPAVFQLSPVATAFVYEPLGILSRIRPAMVIDYIGYAVLGYYIHSCNISRKAGTPALIVFAASLLYTIVMSHFLSVKTGAPNELFFENLSFNNAISAASFMVAMKAFSENVWYKDRTYDIILFFSAGAFGLFMTHAFVLRLLDVIGLNGLSFGALLSTPILCVIVTLISVTASYLIKKIPGVGDYLV